MSTTTSAIRVPAPSDAATDAAYGIVSIYELLDRPEPSAFANWLRSIAQTFDEMAGDTIGETKGRA